MNRLQINPALAALVEKVKPLLTQYLTDHQVTLDNRGWFRCLNPKHPDHDPSMHIIPASNGTKTKCFPCGASYDIFDAHAILEGRPKQGPGWIYQNLYELARRYGIDFEEVEPTEQELLLMRLMRMYQDAADILVEVAKKEPDQSFAYTRARGISDEVCIEMGVGSVPWKAFLQRMQACGHDVDYMKQYDLSSDMFDREHVTFTIRDKNGMVVGFARRFTLWDGEQQKLSREKQSYYPPKFSNTGANVPFFQKEALVYGLDTARKENYRRLEMFEGYFDVLGARQAGIRASACALGTSLTEFQVMQAQDCGFTHINYVGDMDDAGQKGAMKALDTMAGREGLKATVTFLPFPESVPVKDRDPDTYLKMFGAEEYFKLPEYSGFDWKLDIELKTNGQDLHHLALRMIPLIMNEKDHITRGRLVRVLADKTSVPEEDIRAEIQKREDVRIDSLAIDLQRGLGRAKTSLERIEVIQEIAAQTRSASDETVDVSIGESARAAVLAFQKFEAPIVGLRGYKTGFDQFDKDFDGFPKEQQILGIAGSPNCGKSAFVTNMAVNLALYNPSEKLSIIYHIMDDPRNIAIAKIMSCLTGMPIRTTTRAASDILPYPHLKNAYEQAKAWLLEKMHTGAIVVKGQEMGCGTEVAARLIDTTMQRTGNKVVYIADSLHNISAEGNTGDRRMNFIQVSDWAQQISDTRRISMIFTCELTKEGMKERPRMYMTSETSAIGYKFKAVGMVWNALHILRETANDYWLDELLDPATGVKTGDPVKRPIIEIKWEKNKISEFKGSHYFRFWDNAARVAQMSFQEVDTERKKAAAINLKGPNLGILGQFQAALPHAPGVITT